MITVEDCIAFTGLDREEILAIAEHENLPEVAACALAEYLMHQDQGAERIRCMIVDDINCANARGDTARINALLHVLHRFMLHHADSFPLGCSTPDTV
jgi:hypothetical protein